MTTDQISSAPPTIDLSRLNDDQIKGLIANGYKLLDERLRQRQKATKEKIKRLADEAGIAVQFPRKLPAKPSKKSAT